MIDRLLAPLWEAALARPRTTLAAVGVVLLLAAPGLARLHLETDGRALVPRGARVVQYDAAVREQFGLRDPLIVYLASQRPDGLYNRQTLALLKRISDRLASLPGLDSAALTSLATERRDRVDSLDFSPFLSPLPATQEEIDSLRRDIAATGLLAGTLVGLDGRGASVLVGVPPAEELAARHGLDRSRLYQSVLAAVAPMADPDHRIVVVGAPVAEVLLGHHLLTDLLRLLPGAFVVLAVVLWMAYRRLGPVLLGLVAIGACLVFTFGLMGWLGEPVYLPTVVLPVILATVALADEIHLTLHLQRLLDDGCAPGAALRSSLAALGRPVLLTSVTTTAGFLSFAASGVPPLRSFGLFAAVGVLFCLLFSLTALPAALALMPVHRPRRPAGSVAGRGMGERLVAWASVSWRHRRATLLVLMGLTGAALVGISRLEIQDGWLDGFALRSDFRRQVCEVNAALHGTHLLLAHFSFDPPPERVPEVWDRSGPLLDPEILRALADFEAFARARPEVGGVLGPTDHLTAISFLVSGRRPGSRTIPSDPSRINQLWKRFDQGRGAHRRREVVDDELRQTVVMIFLQDANYRQTASLMGALRDFHHRRLAPLGGRMGFAGDVAVSQEMIRILVRGQLVSLVLALGMISLFLGFVYRRPAIILFLVAPTSVAVLWVLGALGALGVPLGVATSTFSAISLGLGVDFALHLHEGVRRYRAGGEAMPVSTAVLRTGPAIATDSLALAAGFSVLLVSRVPATARLGLVMILTLGAAAAVTFVLPGLAAGARAGSGSALADPKAGRTSPLSGPKKRRPAASDLAGKDSAREDPSG